MKLHISNEHVFSITEMKQWWQHVDINRFVCSTFSRASLHYPPVSTFLCARPSPPRLPAVGETAAAKRITTTAPLSSSTPEEIITCACLCASQLVGRRACGHTSSISRWRGRVKEQDSGVIAYLAVIHAEWAGPDLDSCVERKKRKKSNKTYLEREVKWGP